MAHKSPDRPPIDLQALAAARKKVMNHYHISTERELLEALGCDFYYLSVRDITQNETCFPIYHGPKIEVNDKTRGSPLGVIFNREGYDDKFSADLMICGPLYNAETEKDILDCPFPDPKWFDMEPLVRECEEYSDKVVIGGFWTSVLGDAQRMMGYENFLCNLVAEPEMIRTLIKRLKDFYLDLDDRLMDAVGKKMDVFYFGNDFGTQTGMLFSKDMWLEFYYDVYKEIISHIKSRGYTVMVHSCGAITPILPYFVEFGVDILDPVQTTSAGMEPQMLKDTYGGRIVFHGVIDTQNILPQGTPEGVAKHVRETINLFGRNGGYIMASCNNIQADTPVENIIAMYDEAKKE
jgi:uroporphyrinogen decarboxylase